ncbi:hypothetical protein Tco_0087268 [Tanacetum coccineum]
MTMTMSSQDPLHARGPGPEHDEDESLPAEDQPYARRLTLLHNHPIYMEEMMGDMRRTLRRNEMTIWISRLMRRMRMTKMDVN